MLVLLIGLICAVLGQPELDKARQIQKLHPLIDGHNDLPIGIRSRHNGSIEFIDLYHTKFQTDITRMRSGLIGGQIWSVFVGCSMQDAVRATLEQIDIVNQMARKYPQHFQIAEDAAQIRSAFKAGKIASLMGIEGAHQIDGSFGTLRAMYNLGVRYVSLAHNCNNLLVSSCCNLCSDDAECHQGTCVSGKCSEEQVTGLTPLGVKSVREMNRLGMIVDLSHVSDQGVEDALAIVEAPVIFSHSNARALMDVTRNVPDRLLLKLKQNGGIIMITFVPSFLSTIKPSTISTVADHIDYVARGTCPAWKKDCNLNGFKGIGARHIGIGSDFDGITDFVVGLEDTSKYPYLTAELIRRGYTDEEVIGILGENFLRVFHEVGVVKNKLSSKNPAQGLVYPVKRCRSPNFFGEDAE